MNNGKMPVSYLAHEIGVHMPMSDQTQLNFLADWIPFLGGYASIGDMVAFLGVFLLSKEVYRYKQQRAG